MSEKEVELPLDLYFSELGIWKKCTGFTMMS